MIFREKRLLVSKPDEVTRIDGTQLGMTGSTKEVNFQSFRDFSTGRLFFNGRLFFTIQVSELITWRQQLTPQDVRSWIKMRTPWRRDERKKALFISHLPLILYFLSVLPISYFLCLGGMQLGIFVLKEKSLCRIQILDSRVGLRLCMILIQYTYPDPAIKVWIWILILRVPHSQNRVSEKIMLIDYRDIIFLYLQP